MESTSKPTVSTLFGYKVSRTSNEIKQSKAYYRSTPHTSHGYIFACDKKNKQHVLAAVDVSLKSIKKDGLKGLEIFNPKEMTNYQDLFGATAFWGQRGGLWPTDYNFQDKAFQYFARDLSQKYGTSVKNITNPFDKIQNPKADYLTNLKAEKNKPGLLDEQINSLIQTSSDQLSSKQQLILFILFIVDELCSKQLFLRGDYPAHRDLARNIAVDTFNRFKDITDENIDKMFNDPAFCVYGPFSPFSFVSEAFDKGLEKYSKPRNYTASVSTNIRKVQDPQYKTREEVRAFIESVDTIVKNQANQTDSDFRLGQVNKTHNADVSNTQRLLGDYMATGNKPSDESGEEISFIQMYLDKDNLLNPSRIEKSQLSVLEITPPAGKEADVPLETSANAFASFEDIETAADKITVNEEMKNAYFNERKDKSLTIENFKQEFDDIRTQQTKAEKSQEDKQTELDTFDEEFKTNEGILNDFNLRYDELSAKVKEDFGNHSDEYWQKQLSEFIKTNSASNRALEDDKLLQVLGFIKKNDTKLEKFEGNPTIKLTDNVEYQKLKEQITLDHKKTLLLKNIFTHVKDKELTYNDQLTDEKASDDKFAYITRITLKDSAGFETKIGSFKKENKDAADLIEFADQIQALIELNNDNTKYYEKAVDYFGEVSNKKTDPKVLCSEWKEHIAEVTDNDSGQFIRTYTFDKGAAKQRLINSYNEQQANTQTKFETLIRDVAVFKETELASQMITKELARHAEEEQKDKIITESLDFFVEEAPPENKELTELKTALNELLPIIARLQKTSLGKGEEKITEFDTLTAADYNRTTLTLNDVPYNVRHKDDDIYIQVGTNESDAKALRNSIEKDRNQVLAYLDQENRLTCDNIEENPQNFPLINGLLSLLAVGTDFYVKIAPNDKNEALIKTVTVHEHNAIVPTKQETESITHKVEVGNNDQEVQETPEGSEKVRNNDQEGQETPEGSEKANKLRDSSSSGEMVTPTRRGVLGFVANVGSVAVDLLKSLSGEKRNDNQYESDDNEDRLNAYVSNSSDTPEKNDNDEAQNDSSTPKEKELEEVLNRGVATKILKAKEAEAQRKAKEAEEAEAEKAKAAKAEEARLKAEAEFDELFN